MAAVIRHALAEGWLLLRSRGIISPVLALALAIPVSLAGVTVSVRGWLDPVIDLTDQGSMVTVLLHPRLDEASRADWMKKQSDRHPGWKVKRVPPHELAERMSAWFPYLKDLLAREGSEMLPPLVEITTSEPEAVAALAEEISVIAVGPTSPVNRVVGRAARRLSVVLYAVAVILAASAVLLTAVWVHLEVHRNAEEIAIMRLMGATEATVRGPFFVAVALPALIAAVVSVSFTVLAVMWLAGFAEPLGLPVTGAPAAVLAVQVFGAVVLPVATAFVTLGRYATSDDRE
ncbi:MAG: FtsX-like permease family protein [Thermoanaerobaculales bacterium]|nr:FtsX-like permease family protein [Thermoanaerobaculales bacterium]